MPEQPPQPPPCELAPDVDDASPAPLDEGLHPGPALYVVPTPLGNLKDASPRARGVLAQVDVIAAEDTRTAQKLLQLLGVRSRARLVSYHEHNDASRAESLAAWMAREGLRVALVSDAGTPACSDPGYRLIRAALDVGARVIPLPGPAAFLCALMASGLPTDRFLFVGFLPSKREARRQALEDLKDHHASLCLYESPRRLVELLEDVAQVLGPSRRVSVSRELTKRHEETLRGLAADLAAELSARGEVRGEVSLVIEGAPPEAQEGGDQAQARKLAALLRKHGLKPAQIKEVVAEHCGLSKKDVYAMLLEDR